MAKADSSANRRDQTPEEKAAEDEHNELGDRVLDREQEAGNVPPLEPPRNRIDAESGHLSPYVPTNISSDVQQNSGVIQGLGSGSV